MSAAVARKPRVMTFVEFSKAILEIDFTPAQRTMARVVFDGVDPADLTDPEERELAKKLFGGVDRFPREARDGIAVLRLGRFSGKSIVCASFCVYRVFTADLSECGIGDIPAAIVIAPRAETSRIIINYGRAMVGRPNLKRFVVASHADGFTIRRSDGREVQFKVCVRSSGGNSVRGLSIIVAVVDESEFVPSGGANAIVSDEDIIDAIMPRLLPGGVLALASTPWAAPSATSKAFNENFGHPQTAIAATADTLTMRPNVVWIREKVEKELKRKFANARREYFCELADGGGGAFFEISNLERALRYEPYTPTKLKASAGIDPAFVNDSSGLAVVERAGKRLVVTGLELRSPEPQQPLVPSQVIHDFAGVARALGCKQFATDVHRVATIRTAAATEHFQVYVGPGTEIAMVYLRDVIREGKLEIPTTAMGQLLVSQLKTVMFTPRTGGGLTIKMPRSREAGHADLVSALAAAVHFDRRHGPLLEGKTGGFAPRGSGGGKGSAPFPGFMG